MIRRNPGFGLLLCALGLLGACRTTLKSEQALPEWNLAGSEFLQWKADDPAFDPDRALEASGMAAEGDHLWFVSEKYSRILRLDPESMKAQVIEISMPEGSEIEGISPDPEHGLLLTDESRAEIFSLDPDLDPRPVKIQGIELKGSKDGLEGIASAGDGRVYLLLERSHRSEDQCVSTIFRLRWKGDYLVEDAEALVIPLQDCNWRLTGLEYFRGHLLALKTRFPGPQYEVVEVDVNSGDLHRLLEMTDLIEGAVAQGFHGNLEGIAVMPDGGLWMISDNAMTGHRSGEPSIARRPSLVLHIPAVEKGSAR